MADGSVSQGAESAKLANCRLTAGTSVSTVGRISSSARVLRAPCLWSLRRQGTAGNRRVSHGGKKRGSRELRPPLGSSLFRAPLGQRGTPRVDLLGRPADTPPAPVPRRRSRVEHGVTQTEEERWQVRRPGSLIAVCSCWRSSRWRWRRWWAPAWRPAAATRPARAPPDYKKLVVYSTTSVRDSGLMQDVVIPAYNAAHPGHHREPHLRGLRPGHPGRPRRPRRRPHRALAGRREAAPRRRCGHAPPAVGLQLLHDRRPEGRPGRR